MRTRDLLIALAAGTAAAQAEPGRTAIALEWQRYSGDNLRHAYVNMRTGERVFSSAAGRVAPRGGFPWTRATNVPDPCQGAAGVRIEDREIAIYDGIMDEAAGDEEDASAVTLWQNWFEAPADTIVRGLTVQYYSGLQDPGYTPGEPSSFDDPLGIPGYDMIVVFTENDDPDSQATAVAHSPILVTQLPGTNDSDGNGTIDFAEGMLWTFFLDIFNDPIEIADSDGSSANPQGSDTDAPGTVGSGFADCGFVVTFRQPNVIEGDRMFLDNALIDFSNVDLDPVTGIGNPDGRAPDLATFVNIAPTGTGLYAPSTRLETFPQTPGVVSQWPADPEVVVEEGEGYGSWDAFELTDVTGADLSGIGLTFNFGGFSCLTPGGGTDGAEFPYASFNMQFNIDAVGRPGCRTCNVADIAEPCGVLDLADIIAFIEGFLSGDPISDMNGDSIFDLADINIFVGGFLGGCP